MYRESRVRRKRMWRLKVEQESGVRKLETKRGIHERKWRESRVKNREKICEKVVNQVK